MAKINKAWVDSTIITEDEVGAANGVASLDANARIPASQLPTSAQEYKGAFDASGGGAGSPALNDGTGTNGDTYRVSLGGTVDHGAGSVTYSPGDLVIYNGSVWERSPADSSFTGKTTDDLAEGSSNLYFTELRVRNTALTGLGSGSNTAIAATDSLLTALANLQEQINANTASTFAEEVVTLTATDVNTNGYYDLANTPIAESLTVYPDDGPVQRPGSDYTVSTNRVTFAGDLSSTLVAGSVIIFRYAY